MSNLLSIANGRTAMRLATTEQLLHRMSRFFHRTTVVAFDQWIAGGNFDVSVVLGQLNELHDPEILFYLQALQVMGGLQQSVADVNLYVSPTGDDETGTGLPDHPFQTITEAIARLPMIIDHQIRILVQPSAVGTPTTYTDDKVNIFPQIRDGFLTILGVGEPDVLDSGNTLTASAVMGSNAGNRFQCGASAWGPESWRAKWMLVVDGAAAKQAIPMQNNDITQIWTRYHAAAPAIGDEVEIVEPSITWKMNSISIKPNVTNNGQSGLYGSRFVLHNMTLDLTDSDYNNPVVTIDSDLGCIWTDFVQILTKDNTFGPVKISDSNINCPSSLPIDNNFATLSTISNVIDNTAAITGIDTVGATVRRITSPLPGGDLAIIDALRSDIYNWTISANAQFHDCRLFGMAINSAQNAGYGFINTDTVFLNGTGSPSVFLLISGKGVLNATHVLVSTGTAYNLLCSCAQINDTVTVDPAGVPGFGLSLLGNASAYTDGNQANTIGSSGSVVFEAPNPNIAVAWPAAGATQTDALGSYVTQTG